MLANYHTHTYRCNHAAGEDREYIENAIEGGISVLGFSDHCPWIFSDGYRSAIRMTAAQTEDYFSSLTALKKEYAEDITIYIGFEAEYIPELIPAQEELLRDYPVDYMIMGQHFFQPETYGAYTGFPTDSPLMLEQYVDSIIAGLETGKYRYIAHPDLLMLNGAPKLYRRHYLRLCQYLKEKNIPVEINLLGLRDGRHYPSDEFFSIASEVGNTAIIGCDAHSPEVFLDPASMKLCERFAERHGLPLIEFLPGLGPVRNR